MTVCASHQNKVAVILVEQALVSFGLLFDIFDRFSGGIPIIYGTILDRQFFMPQNKSMCNETDERNVSSVLKSCATCSA